MRKRIIAAACVLLLLVSAIIAFDYVNANSEALPKGNQTKEIATIPQNQPKTKQKSIAPVQIIFRQGTKTQIQNPVRPVGTDKDGRMEVPDGIDAVYWYKYGPSPGDKGNAIIAGHRDWGGELGLFKYLEDISVGEKVTIGYANNTKKEFQVKSKNSYAVKDFPQELMDTTKGNKVTLISCTGSFDRSQDGYQSREVVILQPVTK
ncbi:class F sortase [Listeria booriae]|uniref:class F sortase n=1 Tax=Listeria booriae TaxID=1552123 RepID=UPI00162AB427|nr:class F sortase [Listeria booriae]MBC1291376.1 class F sortase [Listeria booriae]MBC1513374.1 class F sortase [Listeria booriae]MBC1649631.1 class F sortase [Listeria booriae]MBC1945088.1 class F sortase [Listeria booriae]MBC6150477.1 class F sortase [Listeria booriae]